MIAPTTILIFVLVYSSIIVAYVYLDANMFFVFGNARWATWTVHVMYVASATIGVLPTLDVVRNAIDVTMAAMTITNLAVLVFLAHWVLGTLRDCEAQRRNGVAESVFVGERNSLLPSDVPDNVRKRSKQKKK